MAELFDIKDVTFYYVCISEPKQKYQTTDPKEKEYSVTVCVSKDVYQEFVKQYPSKKKAPIENDDFVEKYKTPVPFPNQPMQYLISFKSKTHKMNGEPMPESLRPRTYQIIDGKQVDTTDVLIGNGSKGVIRYSAYTNKNTGQVGMSLHSILVTELVPYERKDPNKFDV